MGELIDSRADWIGDHLRLYRRTGGREGHFVDVRDMGGHEFTATLLLRTVGRKSGRPSVVPLLYALWRDEVIIAASNGGADDHPAWFLNLQAMGELCFQIAVDVFRGPWRLLNGEDRAAVWDYLTGLYPPYADYQRMTTREIPLIALKRAERVAAL